MHADGSFEHPKHMFKRMGKKIIAILRKKYAKLALCKLDQNHAQII